MALEKVYDEKLEDKHMIKTNPNKLKETENISGHKMLSKRVWISTEILFQIFFTYLYCLLLFFTEFKLGESVYLNKTLLTIAFFWTHLPAVCMFFNIKKHKLEFLCVALFLECVLLFVIFYLRNRIVFIIQLNNNIFTKEQIKLALHKMKSYPSCAIIFVGSAAKKSFLMAINNHPEYKKEIEKYLSCNEKFVHKLKYILDKGKYMKITGLKRKFMFVYETKEPFYDNKDIVEKIN